jgi:BASS family bile acid:Na+ symporter
MHNATVALGIALSPQLLNSVEMATPAAVYGAIAPLIALTFIFAVRRLDPALRRVPRSEAAVSEPAA